MWASGVDFQTWNDPTQYNGATDDQLVERIEQGIASVAPSQMQTVELNFGGSSSTDDPSQFPPVDLSWVYNGHWPNYYYMLREYNRTLAPGQFHNLPYYMGEDDYEGDNNAGSDPPTPLRDRKEAWWTALSGGDGEMYGSHDCWPFAPNCMNTINSTGATQFALMSNFIAQYPWWSFVPDQSQTVMTAGYGTYATPGQQTITQNDYATTVRANDGSVVIAYLPTVRTVTINMAQLSGAVTVRWFDPTSGTYSAIGGSPFANSGSKQFTPPGNNAAGDPDWVLLLTATAATGTPTATATASPSPTQAQGTGGTVGYATVGGITDSGLANTPSGSRFLSGNGGQLASISVHVGAVDTAPHNQYQVAIYTDANGNPGSLVAQTRSGTLTANSWNTLPIAATLAPSTAYWFIYNTNASGASFNDLQYDNVGTRQGFDSSYPFGSWPQTMTHGNVGGWEYSMFATYAG